MKARIDVRLRSEVLDPQGDAVRAALASLGFEGVRGVRIGKIVEIEFEPGHEPSHENLASMSEKLLCNQVIETFTIQNDGDDSQKAKR